jgi:hypothetical protein
MRYLEVRAFYRVCMRIGTRMSTLLNFQLQRPHFSSCWNPQRFAFTSQRVCPNKTRKWTVGRAHAGTCTIGHRPWSRWTQSPMPSFSASRCDLREPRSSFKFFLRVAKLSSVSIRTYYIQFSLVMMTFKSQSPEKETKLSKLTTC